MSLVGQKDNLRVFTATASEYSYGSALCVRQAPQHRQRVKLFTKDRFSTSELTCIAGSISAASTASQREALSLPAISLYETRKICKQIELTQSLDPPLVPFGAHFDSKPTKFSS